jgi:hypothetical protein
LLEVCDPPLGYEIDDMDEKSVKMRFLYSLNIPVYQIGTKGPANAKRKDYLYFQDILFELIRKVYEKECPGINESMPNIHKKYIKRLYQKHQGRIPKLKRIKLQLKHKIAEKIIRKFTRKIKFKLINKKQGINENAAI